jgi:tetratricopeptide (TPR) repeat protein
METSASQKLARYGLLWLVGVAYVLCRIHFFGVIAPREGWPELTPWRTFLTAIALVGQYAEKLLWPVRLCAVYVFHPSTSPFDPRVLAGLAVLVALAALFLYCCRSREASLHFASFGIVWFLATLAPVLDAHMLAANVFAERYLYLPSVGMAWLAGLGVSKLWSYAGPRRAARRALLLIAVALAGLFALRIVIRNRDWKSDIVLYTRTLEISPDADLILDNLGLSYLHEGAMDKAESAWRRALARNPDDATALNNLGWLVSRRNRYSEAVQTFQRAITLDPSSANPHLNLAETYLKMGQTAEAELQFRAAIELAPLNVQAHTKLGQLLLEEGRLDEAEDQFRACIRVVPSLLAYDYLGLISIRRRAWGEAERAFRAALGLDESDSNAHFGLGYVYKASGRKAEALSQYQAGLVKDPTNAQALAAVQKLRQQISGAAP